MVFTRLLLAALAVAAAAPAEGPAREARSCFPVEDLPPEDRREAEELFLRILDSEGLYTLVGGIKPASSGFVRFVLDAGSASLEPVDRARRLLETFRCGDLVLATVHHFRKIYEHPETGKKERHYEGIVLAVEPLRRLLRQHEREFALLGVSPHSHPMEVLMAVEHAGEIDRWRGYGRLFGFPPAAVDFFVDAGSRQKKTGEFVKRRFVSLPTFARAERGVVYAVAEDAEESEEDARLRRAIEAALADYKERRERYIGPGRPGVARLLRDWFCPDGKLCALPAAPSNEAMPGSR
ncbi:MAG: hypothetical protein KatS3mg005_1642 [Bryobacteraceae bacterium]|nr:MAG: hypothetical protein KatS3mg005_1642 [Bryobacteraceae bacterium]